MSVSDGRAMMAVECLVPGQKIVFILVEGGGLLLFLLEEEPGLWLVG